MNVTAQKFQSLYALVGKPLAWRNHRTTLPQSRPVGVPAPSEREPGTVRTIQRTTRKPQRCGRFSSPLRNSKNVSFYHSSGDTPSVTPGGRASSLREGAGMGCVPFNVPLRNRKIAGDFHRPYETQNILPPKNFRFPPENDTGWARAPTYRYKLKAQLKKELDKYAGH